MLQNLIIMVRKFLFTEFFSCSLYISDQLPVLADICYPIVISHTSISVSPTHTYTASRDEESRLASCLRASLHYNACKLLAVNMHKRFCSCQGSKIIAAGQGSKILAAGQGSKILAAGQLDEA